jgi:branched-chain amino acid transport system substrate-binding protein
MTDEPLTILDSSDRTRANGRRVKVKRIRFRLLTTLAVVVLVGAGCDGEADDTGQEAEGGTVKIGVEGPLTGPQAAFGIDLLNSVKLAVDEANSAGGVLGRTIEIVEGDDQADPRQGVQVARQLIGEDIFAVIGPFNSSVGVANIPIYLDAGVVVIHETSTSETNRLGFSVIPKDYQEAPITADNMKDVYGASRAAIVYDTSTYTLGIAGQLRDALEERDVSVVAFEAIAAGESDYTPTLTAIEASNPDVVFYSTYYPEAGLLARQAREIGVPGKCWVGLGAADPAFIEIAGEAAAECAVNGVPSPDQLPTAGTFAETYREEFGTDPGAYGSFAYDAAKLLFNAVEEAGAWDADPVREQIEGTEGYEGITGTITIDPQTGNRVEVPIAVLLAEGSSFIVDPEWAEATGYSAA